MGFGSISHWVIVLVVVILLFGAKKIPELAEGVGKAIKKFKDTQKDVEAASEVKKDESKPN
jgi:sec-independent protein translocase protein TatA